MPEKKIVSKIQKRKIPKTTKSLLKNKKDFPKETLVKEKKVAKKVEKKKKKKKTGGLRSFGLGKEKEFLVENLSMLLGAGMDVVEALDSIVRELKSRSIKRVVNIVKEEIEAGSPIWKALDHSRLFSDHSISLIRIGERSGRLTENLQAISLQARKNRVFKSRIRSAMFYPVFVIILSITVALGISWFVLPKFVGMFKSFNQDLPVLTKALVSTGDFLLVYGAIVVPSILIVLVLFGFFFFVFKKTKFIGQWILFHIPPTKRLIMEIELSRLGFVLGSLFEAGLPVEEALEALKNSTTTYNYRKLYKFMQEQVYEGQTFMWCFRNYKKSKVMIPSPIQQMIGSGEKTGKLAESLLMVGETYETKTEITAKNLTTILEPIMLVVIGVGIMIVALAIITPIYGLLGNLG